MKDHVVPINGEDHTVRWQEDPGEEVVLTSATMAYVMVGTPSHALALEDDNYFWALVDACYVPPGGGDPTNGGEDVARGAEAWFVNAAPAVQEAA